VSAKQIVLVDDEPSVGAIFDRLFPGPDYRVRFFQEAVPALEQVQADPAPDLVVLDVNMPGLNGFEVCRRLKADPKTRDVPVAMFTEWDRVIDIATGLEAGADFFFSKELDPDDLVYRVTDIFGDGSNRPVGLSAEQLTSQPADIFSALEEAFNDMVERTVLKTFGRQATQLVFGRAVQHVRRKHPCMERMLRDSLVLDVSEIDPDERTRQRHELIAGFAAFMGEMLWLLQKLSGSEFVQDLQSQLQKRLGRSAGA